MGTRQSIPDREQGAQSPQHSPGPSGSGRQSRSLSVPGGRGAEESTIWPVLEQLLSRRTNSTSTSTVHLPPSLPLAFKFFDITCPVCHKTVASDEAECHLVMCLTRPRLTYNEDILYEHKGECVICLEDLNSGDNIARLPCLCIYHKQCIDEWFQVRNSCPEHPGE